MRPDFRAAVMSALPTAGWEARSPRAWRFTAAVIVLLGGFAAALLVAGSAPAASGFGALAAVGGMLQAAILAGAGLLGASWKGLGLVLDELLSSPASLGAFGFLVLCLNLLLVSLIRRRRPAPAAARSQAGPIRTPYGAPPLQGPPAVPTVLQPLPHVRSRVVKALLPLLLLALAAPVRRPPRVPGGSARAGDAPGGGEHHPAAARRRSARTSASRARPSPTSPP